VNTLDTPSQPLPERPELEIALPWAALGRPCDQSQALTSAEIRRLSPVALAYLGDAVYELFVRTRYLMPPRRIQTYHHEVVDQVRAERQAEYLQSLEPYFTPEELDILKRGRNAVPSGRTKRVSPEIYQQASSLETLMGYLYLTDPARLFQLLSYLPFEAKSSLTAHS